MSYLPPGMTRVQFWRTLGLLIIPGVVAVALITLGVTVDIG